MSPSSTGGIWPRRPPPSGGPRDARLARRDDAAWTAGYGKTASHLQRPRPATAPRLSIWSADQTPLGNWGGIQL